MDPQHPALEAASTTSAASATRSGSVAPAAAHPHGAPHRKRNVTLISGAMITDSAESGLLSALFPIIAASLGLATSALGVLVSAGRLISVISGPFWVFLTRYLARRTVLALASGLWGVWAIGAAFSQGFVQLLILNTIAAAGFTAAHVFLPTIVGDSFPDAKRGRVIGWVYGALVISSSLLTPVFGQLADVPGGWRWGYVAIGVINILAGLAILLFLRDPGVGYMDGRADEEQAGTETDSGVNWTTIKELFRLPSYVVLIISRLLSPHPVLAAFAVVLLVEAHGLSVQVATAAYAPFGIGYLIGNIIVGYAGDIAHRLSADHGRVTLLQFSQFAFGGLAFLATQVTYDSVWMYGLFFALMGAFQGWNPILNRPIVMAIVSPEQRGTAFGFMISIVESISYSVLALVTGFAAGAIGTQGAVLWTIIGVVLVNGFVLSGLQVTFRRDRRALIQRVETPSEPASISSKASTS